MAQNNRLKVAIVSGAAHALKYKEKNPDVSDTEILKHVTNKVGEILRNMEHDDSSI